MTNISWHRALVRHWNDGVATIPGWPKFELTEPPYAKSFTGPSWEDFPQGLRDDIDAYCERLGKRHKTYSGKVFPPCKQSTIDMRRRELIAAVRAAVAAGISLDGTDMPPRTAPARSRGDRDRILLGKERREAGALHHRSRVEIPRTRAQRSTVRDRDRETRRNQDRTRAVPINRSHREEPKGHPPDRPERRLARGRTPSPKAHGRGARRRKNEALPGRRHRATRDRHPDPDPGSGAHAEPCLDST